MKLLQKIKFKKRLRLWLGFSIISLMTLGFVWFTIFFPLSFERFNVAQNIFEQYNLIDTYFTIHKNVKEKPTDEIVIFNVDGCNSRDSIAKYIEMIHSAFPKVIGVDFSFKNPTGYTCDSDSFLIRVLQETPDLIVVSSLDGVSGGQFSGKYESFYECLGKSLNSGFNNTNVDLGFSWSCRKFSNYILNKNDNKDTVQSFAAVIAQKAMPDEYDALIRRKNRIEYINYNYVGFDTISIHNFSERKKIYWRDKIVLIGDLKGHEDKHITPINPQMSGVEVHAYILSTILKGNYITEMSEFGAWIISFFIIMLIVAFKYWVKIKNKEWLSVFMPVFQLIVMLLCIFSGYLLFSVCRYYIPLISTLIGIAIMGFSFDLYYKIAKTIQK